MVKNAEIKRMTNASEKEIEVLKRRSDFELELLAREKFLDRERNTSPDLNFLAFRLKEIIRSYPKAAAYFEEKGATILRILADCDSSQDIYAPLITQEEIEADVTSESFEQVATDKKTIKIGDVTYTCGDYLMVEYVGLPPFKAQLTVVNKKGISIDHGTQKPTRIGINAITEGMVHFYPCTK